MIFARHNAQHNYFNASGSKDVKFTPRPVKTVRNSPVAGNKNWISPRQEEMLREMRKKYPNNTTIDLDNVLNGICASLTCLMYDNVPKSEHLNFLQLVYSILKKNI